MVVLTMLVAFCGSLAAEGGRKLLLGKTRLPEHPMEQRGWDVPVGLMADPD